MNENTSKRSRVRLIVLLVLHAICGVSIVWSLLKLVPQYEKVFKDFGAKLPELTIMVINLSAWFGRYWYILLPGLVAGDIAIMLSLHRTGRIRLMTAFGVLLWLAEIVLIGLMFLAILVPMIDPLIVSPVGLSGGK